MHQHASDVIEYVYTITTDNEKHRREMVQAFYGQYFILFKAADESSEKMGLKEFIALKPSMATQVLDKIEGIVQKLVEKGMSRHSLVQAIICEYIQ